LKEFSSVLIQKRQIFSEFLKIITLAPGKRRPRKGPILIPPLGMQKSHVATVAG
jgi:hypothetical protein